MLSDSVAGPIATRIARVAFPEALLITLVTLVVLAGIWAARRRQINLAGDPEVVLLASLTAASLIASWMILSATGLWWHHDQVLYIVAVLLAVLAMRLSQDIFAPRSILAVAAVGAAALVLSGSQPQIYAYGLRDVQQSLSTLTDQSPEAAALLQDGASGTYARIGYADDRGHAAGLRSWTLACPKFHQYPYDTEPELSRLVSCLPTTEHLLISPVGQDWLDSQADTESTFGDFLARARDVIAKEFRCEQRGLVRVCRRGA